MMGLMRYIILAADMSLRCCIALGLSQLDQLVRILETGQMAPQAIRPLTVPAFGTAV